MLTINEILLYEVNKLDHSLIPCGFHGDTHTLRHVQETIASIVDRLGELSATAQGLNKVITSGNKMRSSQNYALYLLKDPTAKGGQGDVTGMLKVGYKHLYLGEHTGKVHEVEPLCILDFYVENNRQRHGLGKKLFDYMLQDTGTPPSHLAVDGPSSAMIQFLAKNYGLRDMIRHANNFAVAPAFFQNIDKISKSGCSTPASSTGAGRFTAPKPVSGIGKIIHGYERTESSSVPPVEVPVAPTPPKAVAQERVEEWVAAPSPVETEAGDDSPHMGEPRYVSAPSGPVGAAPPERPSSLPVAVTAAAPDPVEPSPAGSRRDSQLTDKGFFDVKFYHNKLW